MMRRAWLFTCVSVIVLVSLAFVPLAGAATPAEPALEDSSAPALTLVASPDTVTSGTATTLTARLGIAGAAVQLSRRRAGASGFTPIEALVTDAAGAVKYRVLPRVTTTYRVDYAGDAPASAEIAVTVRPLVRLWVNDAAYRGERVRLSVKVGPAHPGAIVSIEMWKSGTWVRWRDLTLNDDSRAVTRWRPDALGRQPFRVTMAADEEHAAGASGVRRVRVQKPNPYHVPVGARRIVVVDLSQYKMYFFSYGREVRSFPCVLGRPSLPTPRGHFKIYAKGMNPGGPYGARIMSYHPPCAIHGTNEPHLLSRFPRNFSHGCTRLSNANAIWLYDHAPIGTPVWNVP